MGKYINYTGSSKILRRICEALDNVAELGTTHEKAYYGDLGQAAYEHSQLTEGNPHHVTVDDLGIAEIINGVRLILDTVVTTDYWTTHATLETEYLVDHEGDNLVFISGANILSWH